MTEVTITFAIDNGYLCGMCGLRTPDWIISGIPLMHMGLVTTRRLCASCLSIVKPVAIEGIGAPKGAAPIYTKLPPLTRMTCKTCGGPVDMLPGSDAEPECIECYMRRVSAG